MSALKVVIFVIRMTLYIVDGNKLRFSCCHFTASIFGLFLVTSVSNFHSFSSGVCHISPCSPSDINTIVLCDF